MREGANEVWARARFDFINSDGDKNDAAAFLLASRDAQRRDALIVRSDDVLFDRANHILKLDRPLPTKLPRKYKDEGIDPARSRGHPPVPAHARLQLVHGHAGMGGGGGEPMPHHQEGYVDADEAGKKLYIQKFMSRRMGIGGPTPEGVDTQIHADSHPMLGLDPFRSIDKDNPLMSPFHTMMMRNLYHEEPWDDGRTGAQIWTDGLRKHEESHKLHPHNTENNLGQYTGNITLQSLHERDVNRFNDEYLKRFGKDPENLKRDYHTWKQFELEGYRPWNVFDNEGGLLDGDALHELLKDPSQRDRVPIGHEAYLWGLESLSPEERMHVGKWICDGKPRHAKHIFDNNEMGKDSDWIPFLNRQAYWRTSKEVQKCRADPFGPGTINRSPDHSGQTPHTTSNDMSDLTSKQIESALNSVCVTNNGSFSHYGRRDNKDQLTAWEWAKKTAAKKGLSAGHDETRLGLPNMLKDKSLAYKVSDKGDHHADDLTFGHLDEYAKQGLLGPEYDSDNPEASVFAQLFGSTDANGGNPFVLRGEHGERGGPLVRDALGPLVHSLDRDGNPSFSSVLDHHYAGSGGLGLDPGAYMWGKDEQLPGLYTTAGGEFMPSRVEHKESEDTRSPEEMDAAFDEMFGGFASGGREIGEHEHGVMRRRVHDNHAGVHSIMAHDVTDATEEHAHGRLHNRDWKSANTGSINGELGMPDSTLDGASLTAKDRREKWGQMMMLLEMFGGTARQLDEGSDASAKSWMIPIQNLARLMRDPEWWAERGAMPYVAGNEPSESTQREMQEAMIEAGLFNEQSEAFRTGLKEGVPSESYAGGLNIYDLEDKSHTGESGTWKDYAALFDENEPLVGGTLSENARHFMGLLTQPEEPDWETEKDKFNEHRFIPTFDPRHFLVTNQDGDDMSDMSREEVARHLLQHSAHLPLGMSRTPPGIISGTPTAAPIPGTAPTAAPMPGAEETAAPTAAPMPGAEEQSAVESGPYLRYASQGGLWGGGDAGIIPTWDSDATASPLEHGFETVNGGRQMLSSDNPADLARRYLEILEDQHSQHARLFAVQHPGMTDDDPAVAAGSMTPFPLEPLEEAIRQQRAIVNELDEKHYPFEVMDEPEGHRERQDARVRQPAEQLNDTMFAVSKIAPGLVQQLLKSQPDALSPDINTDTGEENWNRANVNMLAILEASERYALGHMTPESNKAMGIDPTIMSQSARPSRVDEAPEPKSPEIHQRIDDLIRGGHKSMLPLLYHHVTKGVPTGEQTAAPMPGAEEPVTNNTMTRDVIKHAVARMKAIRDNPGLAAHEHRRRGDDYARQIFTESTRAHGRARELTSQAKAWKEHVNEIADGLTDEEVMQVLKDQPKRMKVGGKWVKVHEVLDSMSARHKFSPATGPNWGGGIRSNHQVHTHNIKQENEAMKSALADLNRNILHNTGWQMRPHKAAAATVRIKSLDGTPMNSNLVARGPGKISGGAASKRGEHTTLHGITAALEQPLVEREARQEQSRRQPLSRVIDGKHTLMPFFTSPYLRRRGHSLAPSFGMIHTPKGEPIISDNPPDDNFINTHLPLIREACPKHADEMDLQPMHADGPDAIRSMSDHVITGRVGEAWNAWAKPLFAKLQKFMQYRAKHWVKKGESLERLTFLKEDDEREKGDGSPIKAAHRIFDLSDIQDLRGFSGSWVVCAWPEGQRVRITREDDDITTTGASIPSALQDEVKTLNEKDFIIDAIYDGNHLHVIDLLKIGSEDVTDEQMKDRIRALRSTFESTERVKTPQPINTRQTDDEGLKEAVDEIEGDRVMLRDADSTYMDGEARHPKWVLLDNEKRVAVIILGQRGTTRTVYRLGIGPIPEEEAEALGNRAQKLDGKHYMDVGTADGDGSFDEGDHATVTVGSVTRRERDGHTVFTLNGGKLQSRAESNATDSTQTLNLLAKSGVPRIPHTVSVQGAQIIVSLPSVEDDVVYKAHRVENETGILTDTWRIGRGEAMKGDFSIRLAETVRPCWEPLAALMLKGVAKLDYNPRPEREKKKKQVLIDPRPEDKKPKKVDRNQLLKDPVVIKALNLLDALLTKEKMTWTGPKGLAIGPGSEDSAPRGPTELTRPSTLPDFYPGEDDFEKPAKTTRKRGGTTTITTDEGEKGTLRVSEDEAMLDLRVD